MKCFIASLFHLEFFSIGGQDTICQLSVDMEGWKGYIDSWGEISEKSSLGKCSTWSSTGPCHCLFCDSKYFCWKKSVYTKYHHKVAFEQFKKKTDLQISNYGALAQAGFVACWCFCGHLARTEIAAGTLEESDFPGLPLIL